MTPTSLEALLQRPDIWQSTRQRRHMGVSTGFSRLDDCLHLGGWPPGSLVEILQQGEGIGELQLLLPTLARLSSAGHHCLLLSPPHIPYPPGLEAAGVCIDKLLVIDSSKPLEQHESACGTSSSTKNVPVVRSHNFAPTISPEMYINTTTTTMSANLNG